MIQLFRVEVNGDIVTSSVTGCKVTREAGRVFNYAIFESSVKYMKMDTVRLFVGDFIFSGFISAVEKTGKESWSIECRSNSAKLTTPFSQPEKVREPATTSHELMAYYSSLTGVPIVIDTVDLDLGIAYDREGTILSSVTAIAETTKADIFDNGSNVKITPRKPISVTGTVVRERDIFNFVQTRSDINNNGVSKVIVGTSAESISPDGYDAKDQSFLSAEIDGSTGSVIINVNPSDILKETRGLAANYAGSMEQLFKVETFAMKGTEVFLETSVQSSADIVSVKVDGVDVSYTLTAKTNYISFSHEVRGVVEVAYYGVVYASSVITKNGGFYKIDLIDKGGKIYYYQGKLSAAGNDGQTMTDENGNVSTVYTPRYMNYVQGYTVSVVGKDITPSFTFGVLPVTLGYTRTVEEIVLSESQNVLYDGTHYYAKLVNDFTGITAVKSRGEDVVYSIDQKRIILDKDYRNIIVTYTANAALYKVQDGSVAYDYVTMHMDGLEYDVEGYNADDYRTYPPQLPQWIPINISDELGVFVSDVTGREYDVERPSGGTVKYTPNSLGMLRIYVDVVGKYTIDTNSVIPGSYMVLTVGGC